MSQSGAVESAMCQSGVGKRTVSQIRIVYWMMNRKVTGNQSHPLSFKLRIIKINPKILNGSLLALKSSLKPHFISFKSL